MVISRQCDYETRDFIDGRRIVVGYKAISSNLQSMTFNHMWGVGLNESTRRTSDLRPVEMMLGRVEEGFHMCVEKVDAISMSMSIGRRLKVIKVKADPKDIVSVGVFTDRCCIPDSEIKVFVATKVRWDGTVVADPSMYVRPEMQDRGEEK